MSGPEVQHFHYPPSGSLSYVVSDPQSGKAAVIDPVLGFCAASGRIDLAPAEAIIDFIESASLSLEWILETHAHADHLSSAQSIKHALGGAISISGRVQKVQSHFARIFNLKPPFAADGSQFDRLFRDGDTFRIGALAGRVMETPGHTSDSVTYLIGDVAFVGDSLFMTDLGTARCDFPGGEAGLLYDSIQKIFTLPDETRLFLCHDYPPPGRGLRVETTVAEQKESNVHVRRGTSRQDYVSLRECRDRTLPLPALILPAIQVNIRAGRLPPPEDNGIGYIKLPLDCL